MLPRPLHHAEYEKVFRKDRANLIDEVEGLVHSTSARKVDDLVRRGRLALVHVRLCELAPRPEKEEQRRIKEQIREEERALREIEKAKKDAEIEEKRYQAALDKARGEVEGANEKQKEKLLLQIKELEERMKEKEQDD